MDIFGLFNQKKQISRKQIFKIVSTNPPTLGCPLLFDGPTVLTKSEGFENESILISPPVSKSPQVVNFMFDKSTPLFIFQNPIKETEISH